jgi:hypothetical protein
MLAGDPQDRDLATVGCDQAFTLFARVECPDVEVHRIWNVLHSQERIQLRHRFDLNNALEAPATFPHSRTGARSGSPVRLAWKFRAPSLEPPLIVGRMGLPTFGLGAALATARAAVRQLRLRRQVRLTVEYQNKVILGTESVFARARTYRAGVYVVTVTNMSPTRQIRVERVWFETSPPYEIRSSQLPVTIEPEHSELQDGYAQATRAEPHLLWVVRIFLA